ncbi:MAG: DUF2974 domain-containing protein [Lachnospiraceae bacterium]|nr:DUF2974 domain-containing protein [Lachnospiraceae bacterium]
MGNIIDYLDWRGDLPFSRDPFNQIDALLLSSLSYANFDGIVPGPDDSDGEISLAEACERFFEMHSQEELDADKSFINWAPKILLGMAGVDRFKNAVLRNYVNIVDEEKSLQFSAVEVVTDDGVPFISFRGTDDTVAGWKEDFNLSFQTVPAEAVSVIYLNRILKSTGTPVRIGGHSKGGHLAVCAGALCHGTIRDRIENIYDFDGPGFNQSFIRNGTLDKISSRIRRVIPVSSVIGVLLGHTVEPLIVKSTGIGLLQHNPMTWELVGTDFKNVPERGSASTLFESTFNDWIESIDLPGRETFINDLFSVLEASGEQHLSRISDLGMKAYTAMFGKLNTLNPRTSSAVKSLLKILFDQWVERQEINIRKTLHLPLDEPEEDKADPSADPADDRDPPTSESLRLPE